MLYVIAVSIVVLALIFFTSPKRFNVKASRPSGVHRHSDRWFMAGLALDANGAPLNTAGKFIGRVDGQSMNTYGIPSGSTVIASYLKDAERKQVSHGDILIVEDAHPHGKASEYCLRRVERVKNGMIEYSPDTGGDHCPHDDDKAVAIVTAYVPQKRLRGLFEAAA